MSDEATFSGDFHMVKCWLEKKGLATLGKELGLPLHRTDTNYLVHCALGQLFDDHAPKPFSVDETPASNGRHGNEDERFVRVLGYTGADSDALHDTARDYASPTVYKLCDWRGDRFGSTEMPDQLPEELRLRFELRACPVVRKSSAGEGENRAGKPRTWHAGQELDAFLAEAWTSERDDELDRETVYRRWLTRQFDQRGGATVEPDDISMERFSIERMTRRSHGDNGEADRPVHTVKKPDVTLTGTLTVTDGAAFTDLLRSGIGRHKSFGYGMLKVRRA